MSLLTTRRLALRLSHRPLPQLTLRYASSDYGSPTSSADPASDPKNAGPNPSADKEHPGPPPPKAGHGTGGATKADGDGHQAPTGQQSDVKPTGGNVAQKRGFHSSALRVAGWRGFHSSSVVGKEGKEGKDEGGKKPQPKIHDPEKPKEDEEAKKHNEEFEKRRDRAEAKQGEVKK